MRGRVEVCLSGRGSRQAHARLLLARRSFAPGREVQSTASGNAASAPAGVQQPLHPGRLRGLAQREVHTGLRDLPLRAVEGSAATAGISHVNTAIDSCGCPATLHLPLLPDERAAHQVRRAHGTADPTGSRHDAQREKTQAGD
ncbi:hypothetical protein GCM10017752_47650 [Streptomyces roseoviridis]